MQTLLIAVGALVLYLVAYHTYGRFLARKIFKLDSAAKVPSVELRDDVDYVPTKKGIDKKSFDAFPSGNDTSIRCSHGRPASRPRTVIVPSAAP